MKVLLVVSVNELLQTSNVWPPLGLGYLATALRNEHSVEILDCLREKMSFEQFADYVQNAKPDAIGFSVYTVSFESTKRCVFLVKGINPDIITIAGGPHPSCWPIEILEEMPNLDFAFQGEADENLPLLLRTLPSKERNLSNISGLI